VSLPDANASSEATNNYSIVCHSLAGDNVAEQPPQWVMSHGQRGRGPPKNYTWMREIWRRRCGQQDTSTDGKRWKQQHRAGGSEWNAWPMLHPNSISADDQRTTPGKEIWRMRCGQQDTGWRKMEAEAQDRAEDGEEWSVFHRQR